MNLKEELHEAIKKNKIDYNYKFNELYSLNELNQLADQYGIPFSQAEVIDEPKKNFKFLKILERATPGSFYDFILRSCERETRLGKSALINQLKKQGFEYTGKILIKNNHPIENFPELQNKIEQKLKKLNKKLGEEYYKINKIKAEYESIRGLRVVLEGLVKEGIGSAATGNFNKDLSTFAKKYNLEIIKNRHNGQLILPESLRTHYWLLSEVESHYSDYSSELINYTYYLSTIVFWYLLEKID